MKADRALIDLAHSHHGFATPALVRRAGMSADQWRRRLGADEWVELVPGAWRHRATEPTWEMLVHAGALWLGRDAALYGASAIRWLGIEGPDSQAVDFLTPRSRRFLPSWLTLHTTLQWTTGDTVRHDGVRCCTATRAIIDLARWERARTLEAVIDDAVRRRRTSVPVLTRRMEELRGPGRAGIRLLRTLMLDAGGESVLERRFLALMRRSGLPRPRPQVVHHGASGRVIRVDFEFPGTNLVVEVSGRRGHSSDADRRRDARRRNDLQHQGWIVVEFTTADVVDDPPYVVTTVRSHLAKASRASH